MTGRATAAVLSLSLLALVPSPLSAQPPAVPTLTLSLDEAQARALASSHRLAEARARGDAASAAAAARRAPLLPQVAAIGGYVRTNHVDEFGIALPGNQLRVIYPDIPDNVRSRLDLQWPLYTGGRLQALARAATFDEQAAVRDVGTVAIDVRLDVARAFWTLVVARESYRVVAESSARMTAHVRDVGNQLEAGLIPPNDLLTARAQEARQRMLSIQAGAARDMAEADLARLIGADYGTSLVPDAVLEPPTMPASADLLIAAARGRRPERLALDDRLAAARAREQAASAGRRPTAAVAAGADYARPNPRIFPRLGEWRESWDAGVTVSWPLFDGGRTRADTAEASAGVRAVEARRAEFDSLLALDIRQRLSELESSRAALDAADVAVTAATEARRVLGERFAAGVATSTEVIDAQVGVLQAQLDRTQAIAAARLADARLNRTLGR